MYKIDKDYIELKILRLDSLLQIFVEIYYNAEEIDSSFLLDIIKEESTILHDSYQIFYTKF